jgi:hypothetical protein
MKKINIFGLVVGTAIVNISIGNATASAENFVVEGSNNGVNKALNTNNNFSKIDGYPRMSIWDSNPNDADQQFDRIQGNRGGTLLQHRSTGNCMNLYYLSNGGPITTWPCDKNDPSQNFDITDVGGSYLRIRRTGTNLCVDSQNRNNGVQVHAWQCVNNSNQRFKNSVTTPSQPTPPVNPNRPLFPLGVSPKTTPKCLLGGICANVKNDKNEQTSHTGIDYFASSGSEVKAACDGTVWGQARTPKSTPNIWDRFTIIKHENCGGYSVLYGYYGHIDASVSVNQKVKRGDVIGKIGEWGSNSHLHLGFATKSFNSGWGYQVGNPSQNGWINPASLF